MENLHLYNRNTPMFSLNGIKTYARVVDIIDGDSINCIIPLFNNKYYKFNIRLNDIDTCEMKSKNDMNKKLAIAARDLLFELITNKKLYQLSKKEISDILDEDMYLVWIECLNFDKFGRVLAKVSKNETSPQTFSDTLIDKKLAYNYNGEKKLSEEEQLTLLFIEEDDKSH
jgi:endonuclease YncB( thermonuclease family)